MSALAAVLAAGLASVTPLPGDVRLAPFRCDALSETELRPLLKVELRDRLLDDAAPTVGNFTLVSIGCEADTADILSVRQGDGAPMRRRVPLQGVSQAARARNVAVAIAELLRGEPTTAPPVPPLPPAAPVDDDDPGDDHPGPPAALELVEPLLLMPLMTTARAGLRTRFANTDVPIEDPNCLGCSDDYYLLGIEPFVDFALGRGTALSVTLPVTWTEGPATSNWGQLANLTTAIRHAAGERLRVGIGAALSLNVGQPHLAQAESNLFDLDRFRDMTDSLRLQAGALWRPERLYLQGEMAVLLLGDEHRIGTLFRGGLGAGITFTRATLGVEYVVLSDAFDAYLVGSDRFVQTLIVGTRWTAFAAATLGAHLQVGLDRSQNVSGAAIFSAAWSYAR